MAREVTAEQHGYITLKDIVTMKVTGFRSITEDDSIYMEVRVALSVRKSIVSERWYKLSESSSVTIDLKVS